ncbi:unnamed protein product [Vitrella brassicaformis CCMP3155]|uniref:Uncharacterized protein n=1 Tax=Vitrella brassicaformis (strain CCMP3155) TaxID=1169540 RepID=A0A0G4GIQ8_VITBC|nr:unnamed protein product [Vitrella brassicaformis CCMP3155]|eukprot:CEM29759.1 unnamed protein product [Vitrella brassicaformis CCMP3155]
MALCWRAPPRPLPLSRGCSLQPYGLYGCCLQPPEAHFQRRFLAQGAPPLLQTGALDHLSLPWPPGLQIWPFEVVLSAARPRPQGPAPKELQRHN